MALSLEDVHKVAMLARLELDAEELVRHTSHLNALIAQFEALQAVDVNDVEPTSHSIPMFNVFREDSVRPSLSRDEVLANAPEARDGCLIVPRIFEG
jgi:aspartyl-tRNA(Asn)/glutamyl-tRNA(Gln) amidotransferase subunit C